MRAGRYIIVLICGALHAASAEDAYRSLLVQYCVGCHNAKNKTAGLTLENADLADVPAHAAVWEKVIGKLRANAMPPRGVPRPEPTDRQAFVAWLETSIDRAAEKRPNPGRTITHRLNRTEYANAVRDLLALDIDAGTFL